MKEAFAEIKKIPYEGPQSKNPLSFKHYNASEMVEGKTMVEHLRFSVAYWHSFPQWEFGSIWSANTSHALGRWFQFYRKC